MEIQTEKIIADKRDERLSKVNLLKKFRDIRAFTEKLTNPLETEDFIIQVAKHASPVKWHLAHTSWFFEAFFLEKAVPDYETMHPQYSYLFNSYYLQTGDPHCRNKRGNLSRPTVKEVFDYRRYVNENVEQYIDQISEAEFTEWAKVIEIGLNHEQQHQELLLTDLKYMFAQNPLYPVYQNKELPEGSAPSTLGWTRFNEGVYEIGHEGRDFGYDNEFPRHKTYIHDFELANRLVTNGEYIAFIEAGGYEDPKWWLDEGFAAVVDDKWDSPIYWTQKDGDWFHYTLNGIKKVNLNEPVTHVSYFEADAFARWCGYRLPTEHEWEVASETQEVEGDFVEGENFHPLVADQEKKGLQQMFGNLWQWTRSSYAAYPGYQTFPGKLGEYNGKFMCNQYVLRGGSCATSKSHYRRTYRNFFHPQYRWQFTGIRLAK